MSKRDFIDSFINEVDYALSVIMKPNKKTIINDNSLKDSKRKRSINVMRVNHMGEVCAQALYRGQAITTKDEEIKIKTLAKSLLKMMGKKNKIQTSKLKKGSTLRRCPSIKKIKKIGFVPQISLKNGLQLVLNKNDQIQ